MKLALGILIPFFGTTIGSAMVYFMKDKMSNKIEKMLLGFAAGVMIAASIWSLIIPSIEMASYLNGMKWVPATVGFLFGIFFLYFINTEKLENYFSNVLKLTSKNKIKNTLMMILAVTIHNIPEGMAVGVIFAGAIFGNSGITMAGAYALAIGIGIQNFPEGAIISMPLRSQGISKNKSFLYGVISGVVEPISAILTLALTKVISNVLPYLLSFAAGAMIYVVVEELIPDSMEKNGRNLATIGIALGFVLMMILDVALG